MVEAHGPVEVASFVDLGEAGIAKSLLESEGIDAQLGNQHFVSMFWHYSQAVGGIRLLVPGDQAGLAREVLGRATVPRLELVDSDDAEVAAPGDALVERAWKSTLIGFIGLPPLLHLWALWLLRRAYAEGGPASERGRKLASRTLAVSGCMVALALAVALGAVLR
jgi:hypothetical protein